MKTVKQIIRYFRLLNEPDNKELAKMAYESAKEYYKVRPHTRLEFETYQRAFVGAYRRHHAKNQIAQLEQA
jgi:hypothetical protein